MPNWSELLTEEILEKYGSESSTLKQLAEALSKETGESVSVDALFSAHRRYRERLSLRDSLSEYLVPSATESKKPKIKPEDIKFSLSEERWELIRKSNRFIITSAMNNSQLLHPGWSSIKRYARANNACIIVIPTRYRNPTNPAETDAYDSNAWWEDELVHYMTDEFIDLSKDLWLMAHVRIQATAERPLSGLSPLTRGASAIFGHPQVSMEMYPTPQHQRAKILYTTGSITKPNYSDTKAGIKGEFHHSFSATVVEIDRDGDFHIRGVPIDDQGGFYDLDKYYHPNGIRSNQRAEGLVTGDEHAMFTDEACKRATYTNKDSIVATIRPKKIVRHDELDFYTGSHHNRNDPVIQYAKHKYGYHRVEDELNLTARHIDETTPPYSENLMVSANHHDHLLRWLKEVHAPKDEPWNMDIWFEIWTYLKDSVTFTDSGTRYGDPFALWCKNNLKSKTRFLDRDSKEEIAGILVGFHGDQGPNGTRGNINQFASIGAKTVIGHRHTPGIRQGCYQAGTSSKLDMEYVSGPSSWAHCHCAIYPNGKRQLIFIVNGKWRRKD